MRPCNITPHSPGRGKFDRATFMKEVYACHMGSLARPIQSVDEFAAVIVQRATQAGILSATRDLVAHRSVTGTVRVTANSTLLRLSTDGEPELTRSGRDAVGKVWTALFPSGRCTQAGFVHNFLLVPRLSTRTGTHMSVGDVTRCVSPRLACFFFFLFSFFFPPEHQPTVFCAASRFYATRLRPVPHGLIPDRLVWQELRHFGFTRRLRLRPVTADGVELSVPARTALNHVLRNMAPVEVGVFCVLCLASVRGVA